MGLPHGIHSLLSRQSHNPGPLRTARGPDRPAKTSPLRYDNAVTQFTRRRCLTLGLAVAGAALAADKPISDDQLFDQVNRRLVTDPQLGARPLQIAVQDGKVTVTGFVENEKLQKRVDKVVKKVKGVREVDNRVQIRQ